MVIDTLQLDIIVNNNGTTSRINNTTNSLQRLYNTINQINSVGGINGIINGGIIAGRSKKSSLGWGGFFSKIYTFYFAITLAKRLGQALGGVVQKGIDYEETLNLWQVAMKGNVEQAKKFVSEIGKAYGISNEVTMRYQATFKNMLSALGQINTDVAYGLSQTLTQMALDYSSLYNTTIESAMIKFQSALAGQVRPIRSESGYDITENTLYQLYQEIGGTKTVRQLSQTEKRLLRILAIYNQMKDTAKGDLAKTIISTANQMRVMSEQGKELITWIGVAGNLWLHNSKILIKINSYLYAAAAIAKAYAYSIGYVEKNATEDPFGDMGESASDAYDEIKKLQGELLGFDKFQVLSSAEAEDADVISAEITKAMADVQSILSKAVNPAYERSLEILKAWGVELDQDGNIIGGIDDIIQKVKDIAKGLGGILAYIGLMTKPWLVLVGAIEYAYWNNEDFRNSVNTMFTQLGSAGLKVFRAIADLFVEISPYLAKIVEKFAEIVGFLDDLGLLEETIGFVVIGLIAWKNAQTLLNIMVFVKSIRMQIRAMKLLRVEQSMLTTNMLITGQGIGKLGMIMQSAYTRTILLVGGISLLSSGFMDLQNWNNMSNLEKWATVLKIVAGAAFLAATAIATFHSAWSVGVAAIAIGGAVALVTASVLSAIDQANAATANIEKHANGGLATKGSLFYAGEAGPELVTQTSGGGSTIMNMKQLEDAVARGYIRGQMATQSPQSEGNQYFGVDGQTLFAIMRNQANKNGYDFVKVR